MHELNRRRAVANGRGDAFDRAGAHIPGRERAGSARFEQKWLARGSPGSGACHIRSGPNEPFRIPLISGGRQTGSRVKPPSTVVRAGYWLIVNHIHPHVKPGKTVPENGHNSCIEVAMPERFVPRPNATNVAAVGRRRRILMSCMSPSCLRYCNVC